MEATYNVDGIKQLSGCVARAHSKYAQFDFNYSVYPIEKEDNIKVAILPSIINADHVMFGTVYAVENDAIFISCGGLLSKFVHIPLGSIEAGDSVYIHFSRQKRKRRRT